jgi:hypothetical protein
MSAPYARTIQRYNRQPRILLLLFGRVVEIFRPMARSATAPVVVVDDDLRVRESLTALLESAGYEASSFDSAGAFLKSGMLASSGGLIADVHMPRSTASNCIGEPSRTAQTCPLFSSVAGTKNMRVNLRFRLPPPSSINLFRRTIFFVPFTQH